MYEHSYNPYRNNIAIIKEYFKKPIVLALAIMHFLSIVVSVVSAIVSKDTINQIARELARYIDMHLVLKNNDQDFGNQMMKVIRDGLQNSNASVYFSVSVFTILTIVGLALLYFGSRNENPDSSPTAGVTILNVIAIITLICCIFLFVTLLLVAVGLFVVYGVFQSNPSRNFTVPLAGKRYTIDATVILVLAIFLTVTVAITAFIVLFYMISRKRFIGGIKDSLTSVELSNKGAKAFGVFSVLIAISMVFSLISSIGTLVMAGALHNTLQTALDKLEMNLSINLTPVALMSVLSNTVALAVAVLQAKISLGYASYIEEKKYGYGEEGAPAAYVAPDTDIQQTPYSYLAQPKTEEPALKDDSFINPYPDEELQPVDDAPVDKKVVCPNCGYEAESNSPFCGNCGAKL